MAETRDGVIQNIREIITAAIGITLVVTAVWMLVDTYCTGRQNFLGKDDEIKAKTEAYNRQKDVLLYSLALLGTVTGYYLGRVPAEQRAQEAQRSAEGAQRLLTNTQERLTSVATTAAEASKRSQDVEKSKEDLKAQVKVVLQHAKDALENAENHESKTLGAGTQSTEGGQFASVREEIHQFLMQL